MLRLPFAFQVLPTPRWRSPGARSILRGFGLTLAAVSVANAGPNANGNLLFHHDPTIVYSQGTDYCDSPTLHDGCAYQENIVTTTSDVLVHVFAVFPSPPRVAGLTFGIDYDSSNVSILDSGTCADLLITTDDWPLPGSGCGMAWVSPIVDPLTEIAWFAVAAEDPLPSELRLIAHPMLGADFADDAVPSILDPVECLGALGFYWASARCCPVAAAPSAEPIEATPMGLSVQMSPAPTPVVVLTLDRPMAVRLALFDAVGRTVLSRDSEYLAGRHTLPVPLPSRGVFFVRVSSGTATATVKIVKR